jgi:hypothetical protein
VEQYKLPSLRGPVSMIQGNVLLPHFLLLCEDDCLPTSLSATSYALCPFIPTSMMKQELLFLLCSSYYALYTWLPAVKC